MQVHAAGGDLRELVADRHRRAYVQGVLHHRRDGGADPPRIGRVAVGLGLPGAGQRQGQVGLFRDVHGHAVEERPFARDGGERLAGQRGVQDGEDGSAVAHQADADVPVGQAVQGVEVTADRVDNPPVAVGHLAGAVLVGVPAGARQCGGQDGPEHLGDGIVVGPQCGPQGFGVRGPGADGAQLLPGVSDGSGRCFKQVDGHASTFEPRHD